LISLFHPYPLKPLAYILLLICLALLAVAVPHAQAHVLNATRMTVYFTGGSGFAADIYVDLAQSGITYEEYYEISTLRGPEQEKRLAPMYAALLDAIAFHFDGWPVDMTVREAELPRGTLEMYLDYYRPKMTRVRVFGERPRNSVVFSVTTSAEAKFEFPMLIRIEMPGSEMPASALIGERGTSSIPFVLQLKAYDRYAGQDWLLSIVVALGEGIIQATVSFLPHQLETVFAVVALALFAMGGASTNLRQAALFVPTFVLAIISFGLLPIMLAANTSPFLASSGLILAALPLAMRGLSGNGIWVILTGALTGSGVWQMALPSARTESGYDLGYALAVMCILLTLFCISYLPAIIAPKSHQKIIQIGLSRIIGFSLILFALIWLGRNAY
jgi:hypothetical protein